jgi:hypothetical protein
MGIVEFFKKRIRRSKHQVHVRKSKRTGNRKGSKRAFATVNLTGSKLEKYFQKAPHRGPRGY